MLCDVLIRVEPQGCGDQQGRENGLHHPGVEHHRKSGLIDQAHAGAALLVKGLFQKLRTGALAIEGAQYRLGLGKLDHALAGVGKMVLVRTVGALSQASGQPQCHAQNGQAEQRNQAQRPVQ